MSETIGVKRPPIGNSIKSSKSKKKRSRSIPDVRIDAGKVHRHRDDLPIYQYKKEIVEAVQSNQTIILVGETGTGKSTQLPQYLAEMVTKSSTNSSSCVVCTQPRRVAAVTIAQKVADEQGCILGEEVGYSIRFEDKSSPKLTRIKFATDGVLLRECMSDPQLSRYSVVILDEAHERSLQTDILMGLLRDLLDRRPDLRLVIMSATLQVELFQAFFKGAAVLKVPGRQYPVDIFYTPEPEKDFIDAALLTCLQIHEEASRQEAEMNSNPVSIDENRNQTGGVLVFLPGQDDIESLQILLEENLPHCEVDIPGQEGNHDRINRSTNMESSIDRKRVNSSENSNGIGSNKQLKYGDDAGSNRTTSSCTKSSKSTVLTVTSDKKEALDGSVVVTLREESDFEILPLYAAMPPDEQLKVFTLPTTAGAGARANSPRRCRRFILATNIAETSVTIPGITYVVDTGFVKTRFVAPTTGVEMLKVLPVSQFQANQRAGRAGRMSAGKCYRLYTEDSFNKLPTAALPEIQRSNIAQVILQLKQLGVTSPARFPFISPPTQNAMRKAFELLLSLHALLSGPQGPQLTPHGQQMASLPLDPVFSHFLLKSQALGCVAEALIAVSLLSSDTLFLQPHREAEKAAAAQAHRYFASKDGDLPTLLKIYHAWCKAKKDRKWAAKHFLSQRALQHASSVRDQLSALLTKLGMDVQLSCGLEREPFLRCLVSGLFLNVAQRVHTHSTTSQRASAGSSKISNRMAQEEAKVAQMNANISSMNSSGAESSGSVIRAVGGKYAFSSNNDSNNNNQTAGETATRLSMPNWSIKSGSVDANAPYVTIRGRQPVHIHPSSVLFSMVNSRKLPEFVVYAELLITSKQYMRTVSVVEGAWLTELFPTMFRSD